MLFPLFLDVDYRFVSGLTPLNVTFSSTDNRRSLNMDIDDDQFAEGDELIILQLTNFSSVITIGQQTTMITIQENDSEPLHTTLAEFPLSFCKIAHNVHTCSVPSPEVTVGFSSSMYTVAECGNFVEVCIQTNSSSGILSSGGFVTFSVSITPSTAGERRLLHT